MRERGLAESILALFAGRERAAAIYGDLTEMAAGRSRTWFAAAYLRTLLIVGWRTPVAFACGFAAFEMLATLMNFWLAHSPSAWRGHLPHTIAGVAPALAAATVTLWLVFPYVAVRYGLRDRMVQLASVFFVLDTITFLYIPRVSLLCPMLAGVILLAALRSRAWRAAVGVLVSTIALGGATFACTIAATALGARYLMEQLNPGQLVYRQSVPGFVWNGTVFVSILVVAFVCGRLRRWLMPAQGVAGEIHA